MKYPHPTQFCIIRKQSKLKHISNTQFFIIILSANDIIIGFPRLQWMELCEAILPKVKYLIFTEKEYSMFDTKCQEILKERFLIKPVLWKSVKKHPAQFRCYIWQKMSAVVEEFLWDNHRVRGHHYSAKMWQRWGKYILRGTYVLELKPKCLVINKETHLIINHDTV